MNYLWKRLINLLTQFINLLVRHFNFICYDIFMLDLFTFNILHFFSSPCLPLLPDLVILNSTSINDHWWEHCTAYSLLIPPVAQRWKWQILWKSQSFSIKWCHTCFMVQKFISHVIWNSQTSRVFSNVCLLQWSNKLQTNQS